MLLKIFSLKKKIKKFSDYKRFEHWIKIHTLNYYSATETDVIIS